MKNILVPTDFSKQAEIAINAALKIAKQHSAVIHIMHSIKSLGDIVQLDSFASGDFASTTVSTDQILRLIELKTEEAEQNLAAIKKHCETEKINVITHSKQQPVEVAINQIVAENKIDLIVMGSHGASGVSEMIMGSNAQKVVRHAKCPVLTIKNEFKGNWNNIVYASSFDEDEVNNNIPKAGNLAKWFEAQLNFLCVNTPSYFEDSETTLEKMKMACKLFPDAQKHIYNDFSVEDGILAFSNLNKMDAIIITTHGYKALRRLLNNNIVEHLVNHCNLPIISINLDRD